MRILYVAADLPPINSGYANAFANLISDISSRKGVEVDVLVSGQFDPNDTRLQGVSVVSSYRFALPGVGRWMSQLGLGLKLAHLHHEYDVIFFESFDYGLALVCQSPAVVAKTIVRIHGTSETEYAFFSNRIDFVFQRLITRVLARRIINVCATCDYYLEFYREKILKGNVLRAAEVSFTVLGNSLGELATVERGDDASPNTSDSGRPKKILILGRMDRFGYNQKGFIDVATGLRFTDAETRKQLEFVVVGSGAESTGFVDRMAKLVRVNHIERVERQQMFELLNEVDVCCLPSRYEGLSMFALEALTSGRFCLLSDAGGLADLRGPGVMTFEASRVDQLAERFKQIASFELDELRVLGMQNRAFVVEKYGAKQIASTFSAICEGVVNG